MKAIIIYLVLFVILTMGAIHLAKDAKEKANSRRQEIIQTIERIK